MRTLIEKEIRLLLPAFVGALVLAVVPIWLQGSEPRPWSDPNVTPAYLFLFGCLLLALSSYGREIGLKTLPFTLAQPLERTRIWETKLAVLAISAALVYDAWLTSTSLRCYFHPRFVLAPHILAGFGIISLVFIASGLWMTLLLRQIVAAFWLSILVPLGMVTAIEALGGTFEKMAAAVLVYGVAAFFLARRQFLHVQDTAWTGGVFSFGRAKSEGKQCALREHRPCAALFWKELQLQQVTLMGIVCLLVLHVGVVFVRKASAHVFGQTLRSSLEMFGVLWLFVPLLAGSQSVADERQLGTLDGLLCLPVSRRIQFTVKLIFVLIIGGLVSGLLLYGIESMGSLIGVRTNVEFMRGDFRENGIISILFILSLIGFYTSTLTRGVVSALGAGVVASIVFWWIEGTAYNVNYVFGWHLWILIASPTLATTIIWLAFGNFRYVFESGRRWRRNIFGLIAVFVVISGTTAAVYHRVWEWAMPLEEAHGPAILPARKPVLLQGADVGPLAAVLPDGRLWMESRRDGVKATSFGGNFAPGSNWVDAVLLPRETIGIRSDGTLWVSENPQRRDRFVQFGFENDWQTVVRDSESSVVLLKKGGSLWRWANNSILFKPGLGLRSVPPYRLGEDSDWARILRGAWWVYAWKKDGSAWRLRNEDFIKPARVHAFYRGKLKHPADSVVELAPGSLAVEISTLDHLQFRSLSLNSTFADIEAGVRDDGTLWYWFPLHIPPIRIGEDSNWTAISSGFYELVALKTDGSIWKWNFDFGNHMDRAVLDAPVRMGTHNDWVGLSGWNSAARGFWIGEVVTLSADGTLWRWRRNDLFALRTSDNDEWLAPSRWPTKIGNIFEAKGE